jgi:hypothetical protein
MYGMERDDTNPDFLRKDELEYEIFVRKGQLVTEIACVLV